MKKTAFLYSGAPPSEKGVGGICLALFVFLLVSSHAAWVPPIGIPRPSFGIDETVAIYRLASGESCASHPNKCYDAGSGPQPYALNSLGDPYTHYVNNAVACTDTSNLRGTASNPRCTLPTAASVAAGAVIEVRGGPYTASITTLQWNGTASRPVFLRGASTALRPMINSQMRVRNSSYLIIENIDFDRAGRTGRPIDIRPATSPADPVGSLHHLVIRHCEMHNNSLTSGGGIGASSSVPGDEITDLVYYDNYVHPGDVYVYNTPPYVHDPNQPPQIIEQDNHALGVGGQTNRVWMVDNHVSHASGDCIGNGHSDNYTARNYYIGRNQLHDCGENAIDLKEVENFVVSQNRMYNFFGPSAGSSGVGVVLHYGPEFAPRNTWMLFNEVSDCIDTGIQVGGDEPHDTFFIGNIIHDIRNPAGDATGFRSWGSGNIFAVNNVIYEVDNGVEITGSIPSVFTFENNIISTLSNANGLHLNLTNTSYRQAAVLRNNIFYQPGDTVQHSWTGTPPACTGCLVNVDPRFVNPAANDFRLQSNSPAIDAGNQSPLYAQFLTAFNTLALPISPITVDYSGGNRGGVWDIGAYEFGAGAPPVGSTCDLNNDTTTNVSDVQICANQAIGAALCSTGDINHDSQCNVVDVQRVVNAALGGQCVSN